MTDEARRAGRDSGLAAGRGMSEGLRAGTRGTPDAVKRSLREAEPAARVAGIRAGRAAGEGMAEGVRSTSGKVSGAMGALTGALGRAAKVGTAAIGAGLVAAGGFGLKAAADLEQTRISFDSLTGSAERGGKTLGELQQFAKLTPFEFPEVADAGKRFLAMAGSVGLARDQMVPFLTTIGDVASVTGAGAEGMSSVVHALGQIGSTGKLTLENLNQISEAMPGFSGIQAIAAARGISTAEALDQISKGAINAKDGVAALLQGMKTFPGAAGAMAAQAETLGGVFSNFKDTVSQAL